MTEESLIPVFIPPLVTILAQEEGRKGAPLTEEEVLAIRGRSVAMMMRVSVAEKMAEERGFRDIDPRNCWQEWLAIRETLQAR